MKRVIGTRSASGGEGWYRVGEYRGGSLQVYVDGVLQMGGEEYEEEGKGVRFRSPVKRGSRVEFIYEEEVRVVGNREEIEMV